MGNSQGRESRDAHSSRADPTSPSQPLNSPRSDATVQTGEDRPGIAAYASRSGRGSRHDLSFLGIGGHGEREAPTLETRRETKQEREARKLEKERAARLKERERSMREEHVDGGYLVTQGVYVGTEDFNKTIVRQFMVERKLAPFWRGLNDFSESWAEHQLMAAARGMDIPPADQVPPELEYRLSSRQQCQGQSPPGPEKNIKKLTVPIGSRSQSYNSDSSSHLSPGFPTFSLPSPTSPITTTSSSTNIFRTRAKTLASLTTSSRNNSQTEMTPRELQLPKDPFVNGQPIEVYLYKNASECPICFLYYPPYLNTTRCCDQPICSECFVQIKRPDPHPPEHEQPDANAPSPPSVPVPSSAEGDSEPDTEGQLVSEPSTCPFCKMPEFGVTYTPPPFRRGLTYSTAPSIGRQTSAMSSQSSVSSANLSPGPGRRRGTSLSTTAPGVVTTDRIRPDWATKLASARAHQARRSAAATALHTAAYLMGNASREGLPDARTFGPFGRRLRRNGEGNESPGSSNAHLSALAFLAERHQQQQARQRAESAGSNDAPLPGPAPGHFLPPPRNSSNRRSRVDDLEEMMMMEAIRLSLASEEERRRKEEKEAKKEAKRKDKAERKAEKAAKKSGLYNMNSNNSSTGFESGDSLSGSGVLGRTDSGSSLYVPGTNEQGSSSKGKAVERGSPSPSQPLSIPSSSSQPQNIPSLSISPSAGTNGKESDSPTFAPLPTDPFKRSHLRQMSNASSSASSLAEHVDQTGTSFGADAGYLGSHTPPHGVSSSGDGGAGIEPMFNFRSLAATLIGEEEEKSGGAHDSGQHVEHAEDGKRGSHNGETTTAATHMGDNEPRTTAGLTQGGIEIHGRNDKAALDTIGAHETTWRSTATQ